MICLMGYCFAFPLLLFLLSFMSVISGPKCAKFFFITKNKKYEKNTPKTKTNEDQMEAKKKLKPFTLSQIMKI